MRYVKRITAFFLAVIVAVGCVGYRSQKVYANELVLTGEALDVFFGLLGASGVVIGYEETFEQRQEDALELFEKLSAEQQTAYWDWYQAGSFVTSDTGHEVFYPDMNLDTSWYRSLWDSVSDVCSTFVSYAPPVAGLKSYSLPADGSGDFWNSPLSLGNCLDTPFVVITTKGGSAAASSVFALLPGGRYLYYVVQHSTMTVSNVQYGSCSADTELVLRMKYNKGNAYMGVGAVPGISGFGVVSNSTFSSSSDGGGVAWGNAVSGHYLGSVYSGVLAYYDGVVVGVDELIPCDTWVSKWDDAKTDGRQVGFVTGQDLSGYNTLDDIYNPDTGLVTGLDVPAEIPVTGDLTGIAGGIQSILNWLKSLIDKLINALSALLTALFVPTDTALQNAFDPIMVGLKNKMDLSTFEDFKNKMQTLSSPPAPNITMVRDGVTYTVVDFTSFNNIRDRLWGWLRGYLFIFILLYNMNFVYRLIRGQSMFDGMGTTLIFGWSDPGSRGSGGSGGRDRGGRGH